MLSSPLHKDIQQINKMGKSGQQEIGISVFIGAFSPNTVPHFGCTAVCTAFRPDKLWNSQSDPMGAATAAQPLMTVGSEGA
jgi:hypothetical protein